jgi:hypothetical protein
VSSWKDDKRWSDRFLPEIKRILGEHLIAEPPIEEDAERNTDLIVLRLDAVRVACRVRRHNYLQHYGHQFTIRSARPQGNKTELTKIIEGWGDYMFYGFADPDEESLCCWFLGDLKAFRLYFNQQLYLKKTPWMGRANGDGSSEFMAFERDTIPDFIIAQHNHEGRQP